VGKWFIHKGSTNAKVERGKVLLDGWRFGKLKIGHDAFKNTTEMRPYGTPLLGSPKKHPGKSTEIPIPGGRKHRGGVGLKMDAKRGFRVLNRKPDRGGTSSNKRRFARGG